MQTSSFILANPGSLFLHLAVLFTYVPTCSPPSLHSLTFSAFLWTVWGGQLYGCNLTPLFFLSALDALGKNITCQAPPPAEPNVTLVSDYWADGVKGKCRLKMGNLLTSQSTLNHPSTDPFEQWWHYYLWSGAFTIHTLMALPGGTFWVQVRVFPEDTLTHWRQGWRIKRATLSSGGGLLYLLSPIKRLQDGGLVIDIY